MSEALTREQVVNRIDEICDDCIAEESPGYVQELKDTDAALRAQLQAQTARAEQAEHDRDCWERAQENSIGTIRFMNQQAADLTDKLTAVRSELERERELHAWEYTPAMAEARINQLMQQLAAMTQEREQWKLDHQLLCDDYGQLKQQLTASEQRVRELEQQVRDLQASYVHLGACHMELQGVLRDSQDELFTAMQRVHQVKKRLPYPHELVEAQATIDAQFRESTSLNECITALEWQLTEAQATIARLQEAFETVRQRPTEMSALSQAFEQAHTKKECEQLQATVTRLEKSESELIEERDRREEQIEKIYEALNGDREWSSECDLGEEALALAEEGWSPNQEITDLSAQIADYAATVTAQGEEMGRLHALRTACRAIPVWSAKYAPSMNAPFDPITFGLIMGELAQAIDAIERALAGEKEAR